jgi:hypothetical protein
MLFDQWFFKALIVEKEGERRSEKIWRGAQDVVTGH